MGATKKQCDELLEFIRHLAEDDKEGVMATKVNMCGKYESLMGLSVCVRIVLH